MLNVISVIFGLVALILTIPSTVPFLGWGNWVVLPIALIGAAIGALSNSNKGRNLCLIVLLFACIRLALGGGVF